MAREYAPRDPETRNVKSKFVTVAFDPKRRYALEIAARKNLRTISNVIGVAVDAMLENEVFDPFGQKVKLAKLLSDIWSPDPAECFVRTAWMLPNLLTYEEEILWKLIRASDDFWLMGGMKDGGVLTEPLTASRFNFEALGEQWDGLKAQAEQLAEKDQKEFVNGFPFRGGREVKAVDSVVSSPVKQRGKK